MPEAQQGTANYDTVVRRWVREVERIDAEIVSEHSAYMGRVAGIKERRKDTLEAAKGAGLELKPFKALLKKRALERKIENVTSDMDDEHIETLESMEAALGQLSDTPLGAAAKASKTDKPSDDEQAKSNVTALKKGIKGLPGADAQHA